ncbi:MAG: Abi family protein [Desulfosarcina sp.]|nr:Abi family protein [Desulfosarcina sp.]
MAIQLRTYAKPALNLQRQLCLLQNNGLIVPNPDRALHYLRFIGYYRPSRYFPPFQKNTDNQFNKDASFDHILNLYIFDRQLHLLVMDTVERVEVAVRTSISNTMSEQHGPHWYLDADLF